ncbi:MAG: hypothetical protein WB559_07300 [Candidatus Acidiferrales bacterium]
MSTLMRFRTSIVVSTLVVVSVTLAAGPRTNAQTQPLSDDEIRARTKQLLANQHDDDDALELYERVERRINRTGGANPRTIDDKTYRVVPTGAGSQKILLHEEGKSTDSAVYARQMQVLKDLLTIMANPNDPKAKLAYAKYDKRMRDRAQFVDTASQAYLKKWIGRENRNGRDCDVVQLDPDPKFQPHSMFQDAFAHTTAKLWVDRQMTQIVHGEAHVTSDISFGAGILGKLYRGSVVSMDQAEIAPGIWLPTRYQYDYAGRKFLFTFDQHQIIEVGRYRRMGPPNEALQAVQNELSNGKTFSEDP